MYMYTYGHELELLYYWYYTQYTTIPKCMISDTKLNYALL